MAVGFIERKLLSRSQGEHSCCKAQLHQLTSQSGLLLVSRAMVLCVP